MTRRRRHIALVLTPLLALAATPALADAPPASAEQAHVLEGQVRAWLQQMLGSLVKVPERPVTFEPKGDHYRVALPLSTLPGYDKDATEFVDVTDGGDGKWLLSNIVVPSPLHYKDTIKTPKGDQVVDMTITVDKQLQAGVIDTSRAGPSSLTSSMSGVVFKGRAGEGDLNGRIDQIEAKSVLQPKGEKTDLSATGDAHDISFREPMPDGSTVEFAAQALHVTERIDGIAGKRLPDVIQALAALGDATGAKKGPAKKIADAPKQPNAANDTPAARRAQHALILALRDFVAGASIDESVDGLRIAAAGQIVSADHASMGFGAANEAGDLSAYLAVALDGLKLPNLPMPGFDVLVPKTVSLRPVLHGISIETLTRMALDATSEPPKPTGADTMALLSHGFDTGLDTLNIAVGPAVINGHGMVHVAGSDYEGHAQITAKGLDDLIEAVKSVPEAAQAVPVLLIAKGVGKIEGDHLLWVIDYKDNEAKVNGLDLAQMTGQGGGGGGAAPGDNQDSEDGGANKP